MAGNGEDDLESLIDSVLVGEAAIDAEALGRSSLPTTYEYWKTLLLSCLNTLVNCLIAVNAFVLLWFASSTTAWSAFQVHIVLGGIGYQLLMAHGILSMNHSNSWSASLRHTHKRRAHWGTQLAGAGLAAAGAGVMILTKEEHFTSVHGKLALAALVLTGGSLLSGLPSLFAAELRPLVPPAGTKISHALLGTAAFALAMACLCYGYLKHAFIKWASLTLAHVMVSVTVVSTSLVLVVPAIRVFRKVLRLVKG